MIYLKSHVKKVLQSVKPLFIPQHLDYTKFIVIAYARTGSNYLMAGLNSIKSIRMYHELLAGHNRTVGKDYEKILSKCFSKVDKNIKWVGFKVFYHHLSDEEKGKIFQQSDAKIIHLIRKNKLRIIVSLDKAIQTNQWHATKKVEPSGKVTIDAASLFQRMEEIIGYEDLFDKNLINAPVLNITYEDLNATPVTAFQRVTDFLGCPEQVQLDKSPYKKQSNKPLKEEIENYQEVYDLLKNTRYADYLKE